MRAATSMEPCMSPKSRSQLFSEKRKTKGSYLVRTPMSPPS